MSTVIGGKLLGGGWIDQSDIAATIASTAPWAASSYQRGTQIRQCRILQQYNERPLFIAGLLGCPTTRRVSFQSSFAFNIWFDMANPIEPCIPGGGLGTPSFRQRDPFQLVFLAGLDFTVSAFNKAYYCPRCVADTITSIWDEESDPRKVVGMEVTGHCKTWTFLLPDDGAPNDPATLVGAYVYYLANNGGLV